MQNAAGSYHGKSTSLGVWIAGLESWAGDSWLLSALKSFGLPLYQGANPQV